MQAEELVENYASDPGGTDRDATGRQSHSIFRGQAERQSPVAGRGGAADKERILYDLRRRRASSPSMLRSARDPRWKKLPCGVAC